MVDDIPMGNAFFISTPLSFSPIETIFSWVRQMFEAIEQKLNEQAIQMVEFKKEQTTDKVELKKEQAALMADFRIIMLELKTPSAPAPVTTPTQIPPVAIPTLIFTYERREVLPKLFTYHGVKMEFQPWYFQARAKFQVDFTHLSERDRFFSIHSKRKDKIFNQMQAWVKTMTEKEIFSVQRFFDQLILGYDNFQSMEIAAKKLNKMKQGNKQPFSTFISGFEKKLLETRGMDFNDQITKTFFNNVFNNEML